MRFPSFEDFYAECTGHSGPYPWQQALSERALRGDWPDLIDVPTGLGKTGALLAAIHAVAYQAHHGGIRTAPQRIVHVVDRRTVVDQTFAGLAPVREVVGKNPVLRAALARLAGPWASRGDGVEPVLQAIHGESLDSGAWLRPVGCTVLTMTPHQLVSRLLFRGYGVSPRTRSIHAGLLGVDSLLMIDEPHLSHQAIATLRSMVEMQSGVEETLGLPPTRMVLLGATVPKELVPAEADVIRLSRDDRDHPAARRRLTASRPLRLEHVPSGDSAVGAALVRLAHEQRRAHGPERRIGIMVNSIALAQEVYGKMRAADPAAVLRTSRMRPLDRGGVDLEAARTVVATQCLEVGVDIDFDAVLTEACPYPALVQRLGRLNRSGGTTAPEAVMVVPAKVRPATEAVYGVEMVRATADLLAGRVDRDGWVDMSLLSQPRAEETTAAWPEPPRRATFHSGYLDTMTTTFPGCRSDLPVEAFVAGPEKVEQTDVLVCWREDVRPELLELSPPSPAEAVSVPLPALKQLLAPAANGKATVELSDLDQPGLGVVGARDGSINGVLIRGSSRGAMWERVTNTGAIRPGNLVVLESGIGGYRSDLGWSQTKNEPVEDLSLAVALAQRGRVRRGGRTASLTEATARAAAELGGLEERQGVGLIEIARNAPEFVDADDMEAIEVQLNELGLTGWSPTVAPTSPPVLLVTIPTATEAEARRERPQSLDSHQQQVADFCRGAAVAAGLASGVADEVIAAARLHDTGKEHCVFQNYLGNFSGSETWAKSRRGKASRAADLAWARQVGHDLGWRHEALGADNANEGGQSPLAVHLIASHHGRGRPLIDGAGQPEPVGQATALAELSKTFGPWGLAYLEALLRLCDWWASAHPDPRVRPSEPPRGSHVPRRIDRPALPATELTGLLATPVTGWFAAVGLLRTAYEQGDSEATLHWSSDGIPVWRSAESLVETANRLLSSEQWSHLSAIDRVLERGLGVKYQKIGPLSNVPELLREASRTGAWLVTGVIQDAGIAEGQRIPLAIPAFANMSSYVAEAMRARADSDAQALVAALVDLEAGWGRAQCDGGMDREIVDGGVTGREQHGGRLVRRTLAPAALMGMAAFGSGSPHGFGTDSRGRTLTLPLFSSPVTWPEFAATARVASSEPALRYVAVDITKGAKLWKRAN